MVDSCITVKCERCGTVMHKSDMEKVKVESFRKGVGKSSLAFVYGCMQEDLGPAGSARVASSLGFTVNSSAPYNNCKKRLEKLAREKYEKASDEVVEAVFVYYRLQKSMEIFLPRRKRSKISQDEKVEGYGGGKF